MDRVFASEVPDLEPQRIGAHAGQDFSVDTDLAPRPAHTFLTGLPLLQGLERAQVAAHLHTALVPATQAAGRWQIVKSLVEAGLVVHLIRRQMGDHVLDAPSAT